VFPRERVAVFVDGCFWHSCPWHATQPKANATFWRRKLADNVDRDRHTDAVLAEAGWEVMRIWEHEDPIMAAACIRDRIIEARDRAAAGPTG
jgi:DNA mismatch endonuclease (patch repair protein)